MIRLWLIYGEIKQDVFPLFSDIFTFLHTLGRNSNFIVEHKKKLKSDGFEKLDIHAFKHFSGSTMIIS
jgi:hypothetical protein